jgi:hypothetical protein
LGYTGLYSGYNLKKSSLWFIETSRDWVKISVFVQVINVRIYLMNCKEHFMAFTVDSFVSCNRQCYVEHYWFSLSLYIIVNVQKDMNLYSGFSPVMPNVGHPEKWHTKLSNL